MPPRAPPPAPPPPRRRNRRGRHRFAATVRVPSAAGRRRRAPTRRRPASAGLAVRTVTSSVSSRCLPISPPSLCCSGPSPHRAPPPCSAAAIAAGHHGDQMVQIRCPLTPLGLLYLMPCSNSTNFKPRPRIGDQHAAAPLGDVIVTSSFFSLNFRNL